MSLAKRGLLAALLLFALMSVVAMNGDLKVQHDSGVYIALAKSLATGQGYRTIYLAGHPPHTRYPPVFPLLLAPLVGVAGYHFLAMKLLVTAIALLTLSLLYNFFSRLADDVMAFLVVIFTATSHGLLFYAQSIMTEIPYLCLSLLALLWVHYQTQRQAWSRTTMAIAVALISLTYLTRLIGLSLLVATVVYLTCDSPGRLKIRLKRAMTIGGFAVLPALVWFLRNGWVGERGGSDYATDFHLRGVYAADSSAKAIATFFAGLSTNPTEYAFHATRVIFSAPWFSSPVIPLLLTLLICGGFLWHMLHKRTVLEYYMVFYMIILLPLAVDNPQRYLVPLIPFIWYYFLSATGRLLAWLHHKVLAFNPGSQHDILLPTKLLVLSLLIANATMAVVANAVHSGREGYYHVMGEEGYRSVVPWVPAHVSPDSVFVWAKPGLRFLWTGRKAVDYPRAHDVENVLRSLHQQHVDYVVVDAFSDVAQRRLRPVVQRYPEYFRLEYKDDVSEVYRVERPSLNARPPTSGRSPL